MIKEKFAEILMYNNAEKLRKYVLTGIVIVAVAIVVFMGSAKVELEEDSLHASAFLCGDVTVNYEDIERVVYEKDIELGNRDFGVGSFQLQAGTFSNVKFGEYKLYSYSKCKEYVVIQTEKTYVVLNDKTPKKTETLYKNILEKVK